MGLSTDGRVLEVEGEQWASGAVKRFYRLWREQAEREALRR
ncbi:hypothetical protein [Streptomyces sp. st140]|nr:hypothetical protein [Streptomyces sp. st140]